MYIFEKETAIPQKTKRKKGMNQIKHITNKTRKEEKKKPKRKNTLKRRFSPNLKRIFSWAQPKNL